MTSENVKLADAADNRLLNSEDQSRKLEDAMAETVAELQGENEELSSTVHDLEQKLRQRDEVCLGL